MNQTILVMDDDEVLGPLLARVLTRTGDEVVRATTAAQALQLAREHRPQLGLLDLCLRDADGAQLAQELQAELPELRLVLMTAYPLRLRDRHESADMFIRVLTKPVDLSELRRTIAGALTALPAAARTAPVESTPRSTAPFSGALG